MTAHYVYRCFSADGRLIYVGMAKNLFGRLQTHGYQSWWLPQVVKVKARVYPDVATARKVETAAIRSENPSFNIWGRAVAVNHHKWSPRDFADYAQALLRTNAGFQQVEHVFELYENRFDEAHPEAVWFLAKAARVLAERAARGDAYRNAQAATESQR